MTKMEKLMRQIQSDQEDLRKRTDDADKLQAEINELDKRRDLAIDQDDLETVEKLARQRAELMIKLESRRAVNARKAEKLINKQDILDAWNDDCMDYQRRVSAAQDELIQALITAAQKTKDLADIAVEGYNARLIAIRLVGGNDSSPEFNFPRYNTELLSLTYLNKDYVKEGCPGVHEYLTMDPTVIASNWLNMSYPAR